jgi:hypothetical protein
MAFPFFAKSCNTGRESVKEKEKCGEIRTLKFILNT